MSILIASHAWHEENFGGAYKLAAEFGEYLAGRGHEVHFLCGTGRVRIANPSYEKGMKIWRYPFPKAASPSPANLLGHLRGAWQMAREIGSKTAMSHISGHSPLQFLGTSWALGGAGCRRVYSVHSPFVDELKASGDRQWARGMGRGWGPHEMRTDLAGRGCTRMHADKRKSVKPWLVLGVAGWIEEMIYRGADCIQCDSGYSLSLIKEQYSSSVDGKGVVCSGWVDVDRFRPTGDRNELRRQLGAPWKLTVPVFLSVRRLEARMGLDRLIEAAVILQKNNYEFDLLIGGAGPLEPQLRQLITDNRLTDNVFLLGPIPDDQLVKAYAAADCFVLPTRALECFGLIVLEAHACGTPVIATPVGSIPEVIGAGNEDWLCNDTSAEAIAEKMQALLDRRLSCDPQALRRHAEEYEAARMQERLTEVVLGAKSN